VEGMTRNMKSSCGARAVVRDPWGEEAPAM